MTVLNPDSAQIAFMKIVTSDKPYEVYLPEKAEPEELTDYEIVGYDKFRTAKRAIIRKGYTKVVDPKFVGTDKVLAGDDLRDLIERLKDTARTEVEESDGKG